MRYLKRLEGIERVVFGFSILPCQPDDNKSTVSMILDFLKSISMNCLEIAVGGDETGLSVQFFLKPTSDIYFSEEKVYMSRVSDGKLYGLDFVPV